MAIRRVGIKTRVNSRKKDDDGDVELLGSLLSVVSECVCVNRCLYEAKETSSFTVLSNTKPTKSDSLKLPVVPVLSVGLARKFRLGVLRGRVSPACKVAMPIVWGLFENHRDASNASRGALPLTS